MTTPAGSTVMQSAVENMGNEAREYDGTVIDASVAPQSALAKERLTRILQKGYGGLRGGSSQQRAQQTCTVRRQQRNAAVGEDKRDWRIAVLNCGGAGLRGSSDRISTFGRRNRIDILLLNEVHLAAGEPEAITGYSLLWQPRQFTLYGARAGGVAVAVSESSTGFETADVMQCCESLDALWVRLNGAALLKPVFVCAAYIPPVGKTFVCKSDCTNIQCPLSHVDAGLEYIASTATEYARIGDVIIGGDFNIRAERVDSPRWADVQAMITQAQLRIDNVTDAAGTLLPTRRGHSGKLSVLDLVLTQIDNAARLTVTMEQNNRISDHYPILLQYEPQLRHVTGDVEWPKRYGFTSGLPHHLRGRLPMNPQRDSGNVTQFQLRLQSELALVATTSAPQLLAAIEMITLVSGRDSGVISKKDTVPPALRQASQLQRRIDTVTRRLEDVLRQTQLNMPAVLVLQQQLAELERARTLQLSDRRAAQRARRRMKRNAVQQDLDAMWLMHKPAELAKGRGKLAAGQLSARRRHHTALPILQRNLWRLQQGLGQKYTRRDVVELDRYELCECWAADEKALDAVSVYWSRPPTIMEIADAIRSLDGTASAIGVPVAAVKLVLPVSAAQERLVQLFDQIWNSGEVPDEFCVVRAQLLYKSGPVDQLSSYRTIGICTAMSRIFQHIVNCRLQKQIQGRMSEAQYGFLAGKATELCVYLSNSATTCAQLDGNVVDTVLLDIAGAFPTTGHSFILKRLVERGIDSKTRQLLTSWFSKQRMFTQIGRLTSDVFPVTLGLTEGAAFSPTLFIIGVDIALHNLEHHMQQQNMRLGVQLVISWLRQLFYADDGRLFGTTPPALQALLTSMSGDLNRIGFALNAAPTKSAWMRRYPMGKVERKRAKKQQLPQYQLADGVVLPQTTDYKYLGVMVTATNQRADRIAQLKLLAPRLAGIQRQAASAATRSVSLLHGLYIYKTYWQPQFMYAAGVQWGSVPKPFATMETRVMKTLMHAPHHPDVVLRSIFGLATLQTRLDVDRWRVLLRLLCCPPGSQVRQQFAVEIEVYERTGNKTLWWSDTRQLLRVMDVFTTAQFRLQYRECPQSWLQWAMANAVDFMSAVQNTAVLRDIGRLVLLEIETDRRRRELQRCTASLDEVTELLDTPNMAPFIVDVRREATQHRVLLRGGVRTWFGHKYLRTACCPWCDLEGGFTVPHLIRDCPAFNDQRTAVWNVAKQVAVSAKVGNDHVVQQHAQQWYLVSVGAAVSNSFLKLHLNTPSHFARQGQQAATTHLRIHLQLYRRILHVTGQFLQFVYHTTLKQLELRSHELPQRLPHQRHQTTINHWGYEQAKLVLGGLKPLERPERMPIAAVQPEVAPAVGDVQLRQLQAVWQQVTAAQEQPVEAQLDGDDSDWCDIVAAIMETQQEDTQE